MSFLSGNTEKDLVKRASRRDAAAIKSIYDKYVQYLAAVCRSYVSSEDDVKDLLQESFLKIFSSLEKFEWRGEGSLKKWMRRIVVNESLMFLRSKVSFKEESLPEDAGMLYEQEPSVDDVSMGELMRLIGSLPTGYRTIFNLYVFEQKSHKEIASLLGISENTSYSQFSRAKALLAKKIKEYESDK